MDVVGPAAKEWLLHKYKEKYGSTSAAMQKMKRDVHLATSTLFASEDVGMAINKINRFVDEYYMMHGNEPTESEISAQTGISQDLVRKYMKTGTRFNVSMNDNFTPSAEYIELSMLAPDMGGKEGEIVKMLDNGMDHGEIMKKLKLSKSSYYRSLDKIRSIARDRFAKSMVNDAG